MNSPGVRFPPPLWMVLGFAAGWLLETRVRRLPITASADLSDMRSVGGWVLVVGGVALIAWGMLTFARARTGIMPHHAASQVVERGPYRFTRNPMYLGFAVVFTGGALLLNSLWPFVFLPFSLLALSRFVIAREERYLRETFGAGYTDYQSRVRRWL